MILKHKWLSFNNLHCQIRQIWMGYFEFSVLNVIPVNVLEEGMRFDVCHTFVITKSFARIFVEELFDEVFALIAYLNLVLSSRKRQLIIPDIVKEDFPERINW